MLPRAFLLALVAAVALSAWIATFALCKYRRATREIGLLEARQFETLRVVTVGTGGAYENPTRRGPAIALGIGSRVVLVDAGRAVAEGLRAARIPVAQPDTVYLTSLLPENTVGLDDLLVTGWRAGRSRPLRVVGPPGTRELVRGIEAAQRPGASALTEHLGLPAEGHRFEAWEIEGEASEASQGIAVRAVALPGGPWAAVAYRFEAGNRSAVVGSVGFGTEALRELARDAELLVHGAVFLGSVEAALEAGTESPERLRREAALQLPLAGVARLAQRAGVRTLVLVRLQPPPLFDFQFERLVGESVRGRVVVAQDGQEITP